MIVLKPDVNPTRFSVILEGVVLDAVDRSEDGAHESAVLDALVELESVDEVFGDEATVFGAVAPSLGRDYQTRRCEPHQLPETQKLRLPEAQALESL